MEEESALLKGTKHGNVILRLPPGIGLGLTVCRSGDAVQWKLAPYSDRWKTLMWPVVQHQAMSSIQRSWFREAQGVGEA